MNIDFCWRAVEQIVAGEPRLRVLYQVFILSNCRDSRGHLNSDVMLLPFDQLCGSRLNYKLVHAFVRLASLGGIALVFVVVFAGRLSSAALETLTVYLF